MAAALIFIFVAGYLLIALENWTRISKTAVALLMAVVSWAVYYCGAGATSENVSAFTRALGETSEILFFLLGAMVIVEVVDTNGGFDFFRKRLYSASKVGLLWKLTFVTFFLSAVLDNMTTAIIMVMILDKLVSDRKDKLLYASMVILSANSGGAFSPIGDVTTIMLWVKGNITTFGVIRSLLLPSLVSVIIPAVIVSLLLRRSAGGEGSGSYGGESSGSGGVEGVVSCGGMDPETAGVEGSGTGVAESSGADGSMDTDYGSGRGRVGGVESVVIFCVGVGGLLSVPMFRFATGLPPFMGILLVLAILWIVTEIMFRQRKYMSVPPSELPGVSELLHKIDMSTILFFLGILTTVAVLAESGILKAAGSFLDRASGGNPYLVTGAIGFLSAVVDNVPLVAGCMGMYDVAPSVAGCMGTYDVAPSVAAGSEGLAAVVDEVAAGLKAGVPAAIGEVMVESGYEGLAAVVDEVAAGLETGVPTAIGEVMVETGSEGLAAVEVYGVDGTFWELLAYSGGIGGSMLIIGSAAGVVVMGLQKISFGWYLRHFSWIACLGFLAGLLAYWLQDLLTSLL